MCKECIFKRRTIGGQCLHVCGRLVGYAVLDVKECSWHNSSLKQLETTRGMKWRIKSIVGCDDNVLSLY